MQFDSGDTARDFILAGNATVTLVSGKTGTRFTYRVRSPEKIENLHFVSVLTGSSNENDYSYLGTIFSAKEFAHGKKSKIGKDATSARAWAWAWNYLSKGQLPPNCEVWHDGRCGRCGRKLTTPESVAKGLGPECSKKVEK
jgi:hypothetical protein